VERIIKNEILRQIKETIEKWDTSDIYVISLWVSGVGDNPLSHHLY